MISGRTWCFGDNINSDLMVPGPVVYATPAEQARAVFSANRPGWVDEVKPGDIIVGGQNFGMGSSRPGARSLRTLGVACLLAESLNGLFFRNAVNFGFLALRCPGVSTAFTEGQTAEVSVAEWRVRNVQTGATLACEPVPPALLKLMLEGGIFPSLERDGLIAPKATKAK